MSVPQDKALLKSTALFLSCVALSACQGDSGEIGATTPVDETLVDLPDSDFRDGMSRADFETAAEYQASNFLDRINAAARYVNGAFGQAVLVGVIDTGVNATHSDLLGSINLDVSYDYATDSETEIIDSGWHGTHVAGIITGNMDGEGMHGVAPDAKVASLRVFGATSYGTMEMLANAYDRLIAADAQAVNLSLAFSDAYGGIVSAREGQWSVSDVSYFFGDFINAAYRADAADMISVWAAGNNDGGDPSLAGALPYYFPSLADSWLNVVALDERDQIADFSAVCGISAPWCIAAPGVSIYSTVGDTQYAYASGTSMAAPVVTGSIALLKSEFPELTGSEIVRILKDTATDIGAPGVDAIYGNGALNLENALAPAGELVIAAADTIYGDAYAVDASGISGSGPVLEAFKAGLDRLTLSVMDEYDRGYDVSAGLAVSALEDLGASATASVNYASGERLDSFSALAGGRYDLPLSTSGLEVSFSEADRENRFFELAYRSETDFGAMRLGLGHLSETDSFLGVQLSGAFAANTTTTYLDADWDFALAETDMLSLGVEYGLSDLSGDALLQRGSNIASSAFSIDYSTDLGKGRFSIGLASLLRVDHGSISMDRPVGIAAAVAGERGTDIRRETSDVNLGHGGRDYLLNLGYTTPVTGWGAQTVFDVGASFNTERPEDDMALTAQLRITF